jgi:hypothetical protein
MNFISNMITTFPMDLNSVIEILIDLIVYINSIITYVGDSCACVNVGEFLEKYNTNYMDIDKILNPSDPGSSSGGSGSGSGGRGAGGLGPGGEPAGPNPGRGGGLHPVDLPEGVNSREQFNECKQSLISKLSFQYDMNKSGRGGKTIYSVYFPEDKQIKINTPESEVLNHCVTKYYNHVDYIINKTDGGNTLHSNLGRTVTAKPSLKIIKALEETRDL